MCQCLLELLRVAVVLFFGLVVAGVALSLPMLRVEERMKPLVAILIVAVIFCLCEKGRQRVRYRRRGDAFDYRRDGYYNRYAVGKGDAVDDEEAKNSTNVRVSIDSGSKDVELGSSNGASDGARGSDEKEGSN